MVNRKKYQNGLLYVNNSYHSYKNISIFITFYTYFLYLKEYELLNTCVSNTAIHDVKPISIYVILENKGVVTTLDLPNLTH